MIANITGFCSGVTFEVHVPLESAVVHSTLEFLRLISPLFAVPPPERQLYVLPSKDGFQSRRAFVAAHDLPEFIVVSVTCRLAADYPS